MVLNPPQRRVEMPECLYDEASWFPCMHCKSKPQTCPYRDPDTEEYKKLVSDIYKAQTSNSAISPIAVMCREVPQSLLRGDRQSPTRQVGAKAAADSAQAVASQSGSDEVDDSFDAECAEGRIARPEWNAGFWER